MQELIEIGLKKVLPGILINHIAFYSLYKILVYNECIFDVAYAVSHLVAGSIYAYHFGLSSFDNKLKFRLLALWTARLAGFVFYYRIMREFSDPRYQDIFVKYKEGTLIRDVVVFGQNILQGFIVLLTSSSLYLRTNQIKFNWQFQENRYSGYILKVQQVMIIYIYDRLSIITIQRLKNNFQTKLFRFGYYQLQQKKLLIFQEGLWKKSRHPNLFFDLMTWTTIAIASIKSIHDILALISPLVLYYVMAGLNVPLTESLMRRKRGDTDIIYCSKTNKFLPI